MIDPDGLMRDNILAYGKKVVTVDEINRLQLVVRYGDNEKMVRAVNRFKSVELTKDWLLKFGFVKVGELFIKGDYECSRKGGKWYFIICTYMDSPPSVTFKYVHELQNIYYIHTKQKLTVK